MQNLNPQEVGILSEAAKNPPFYPIIVTAVNSGLRQAELLGLGWQDVNLGLAFVSVSQVLYKRSGVCESKEPKADQLPAQGRSDACSSSLHSPTPQSNCWIQ
jgi:hypothetical protein